MLALMKVYFSLLYVEWLEWMPKNVIECWLKCNNRYWIWFMRKCSLFRAVGCPFTQINAYFPVMNSKRCITYQMFSSAAAGVMNTVSVFRWLSGTGEEKMDLEKSVVFASDGVPVHLDLAIPVPYVHSLCFPPRHRWKGWLPKSVIECWLKRKNCNWTDLCAYVCIFALMNVSSHYWSPFHANDCVFSRNEQQKVCVYI